MNGSLQSAVSPDADGPVYDRGFWLAYVANTLLVCANALTFRFAEFVAALGGTEKLSGEIVSVGLVAAIGVRFWFARAIDHYGPRQVWLLSAVAFIGGSMAFLIPDRLSPILYLARVAYQVGLAGMFSCSIVHIQNQVPAHRRTEIIGSLGSSGFVGNILGTELSDLMFFMLPAGEPQFLGMFGGAALLAGAHAAIVFALTRDDVHVSPEVTPGPLKLLIRYWPGPVTVVAVALGAGLSVTTVFLTRFVTALELTGIGLFFLPYSLTAFACRWMFRDWGTTFGRHKMVLWGLSGLTVGMWLFPAVTSNWLLVLPAIACGFGHSLLFPAIVSIGAGRFPVQYRGTGTTLVLGFTELGTVVAAPLLGLLIDVGNAGGGVRGFSWMFVATGAFAALTAAFYALTAAQHPDHDHRERPLRGSTEAVEAESDMGDLVAVPPADAAVDP